MQGLENYLVILLWVRIKAMRSISLTCNVSSTLGRWASFSISEHNGDDSSFLLAVLRLNPSLVAIERGTGAWWKHSALSMFIPAFSCWDFAVTRPSMTRWTMMSFDCPLALTFTFLLVSQKLSHSTRFTGSKMRSVLSFSASRQSKNFHVTANLEHCKQTVGNIVRQWTTRGNIV